MDELNNDYTKYLTESRINTVVLKLSDIVFDDEIYLDKNNIIDYILSIMDLVDESGKKIFKLDDNYHFDKQSNIIFKEARKNFEKECEECKDIISKENIDSIKSILDLMEKVIESEEILKPKTKVKFITIPISKNESILDYDISGRGTDIIVSGKKYQTKPPHKYEFNLLMPSPVTGKSNAEVLLKELEQIEKVLSSDPCIVKHTGSHQPFQSEGSSQVKRNVAAATRIQLNQFGENIVAISGIFHKEGQNDLSVQSEYETRKDILKGLKDDINLNISACEKTYYNFKLKLIRSLYSSKIEELNGVYRYMIMKTMENDQLYNVGKGM